MKGSWASGQWPSYSELIVPFRERDVHVKGSLAITSLSPCKGLMALVIFPFGFVTLAISSSAFSIFQIQITLIFQYQSTETGGPGAHGLRVQKPAEGVSRGEQGHAPIQPPKMGDVRVQDPLLSLRLVTHYLARVKGYSYCLPFFFRFCCCWCCFSWHRSCFYYFCCCNDIWLKKIPTLKTIRMLQNMIVSLFVFCFFFCFFFLHAQID